MGLPEVLRGNNRTERKQGIWKSLSSSQHPVSRKSLVLCASLARLVGIDPLSHKESGSDNQPSAPVNTGLNIYFPGY